EPVAPVFDIIFVGEAEESLNEFLSVYKGSRDRKAVKHEALSLEGIYIPEFYNINYNNDGTISGRIPLNNAPEKIKRRYLKDLSLSPVTTSIVTPESEFSDMYLIEAMRGCPWNCRFCLVGHIYSPVRKKDIDVIRAEIEDAKKITQKIGLIGPSLTDYAHIKEVLSIAGVDFSITSLRASARSAELIGLLKGHKSVSIAPEAGTERMRRVIDKRVTEKDILETSELIFNAGIENLRLYFMIGLPAETEEDVSGIAELVKKIRRLSRRGNIILSVSTFVPKPFTPFQWHPMETLKAAKDKLKFIKKSLKDDKGVKVFHDVPKYAHMQGLFSMGDRRVLRVLEAMVRSDDLKSACAEAGLDMGYYVFRHKGLDELLPWDFIDAGVSKERLREEYASALS
ncbi:MAG: radical SAM protein, partial [Nitrospirae bacterium]|nr:radical SAM protein [Nitrospirota bacterium]